MTVRSQFKSLMARFILPSFQKMNAADLRLILRPSGRCPKTLQILSERASLENKVTVERPATDFHEASLFLFLHFFPLRLRQLLVLYHKKAAARGGRVDDYIYVTEPLDG